MEARLEARMAEKDEMWKARMAEKDEMLAKLTAENNEMKQRLGKNEDAVGETRMVTEAEDEVDTSSPNKRHQPDTSINA